MRLKTLTTIGILGLATTALAAPSAFEAKRCGALNIKNLTTSTVIRDHQDCSKVWVMPPEMGTVKTKHFKKSGNLGFCAEMKNIQGMTRRISAKIGMMERDINDQSPRIQSAERKLVRAEEIQARSLVPKVATQFRNLEERITVIENQLESLEEKLNTCESACEALEANYKDLRIERRNLNKEMYQIRRSSRTEIIAYEKATSRVEAAERHLEFVQSEVDDIIEKKSKLHSKLLGLYTHYGKLEGGYVGVQYDLNWDHNINLLEAQYPQFNFSKVPTKDTRIYANFIGSNDRDSYLQSLPMILDYSLGGIEYQPYGEERDAQISSVPSAIQGDLRLSIIGACPYYYSNFLDDRSGDLTVNPSAESTQMGFGLSMSYKYPAVFRFNLKASYNLYKFYKKVVSSNSKGGFFSRKSWTSVSETKIDKDTFKIEWFDEGSLYSQEEKQKIRNTVKSELIARALQNMAEPAGARPPSMTAINSFNPEPGALVVAKGLEKTCGWYSFKCRAGAWALKGLTSIFGSSRSEASFQSTHDSTATEIWNEKNIIWRAGATSFIE